MLDGCVKSTTARDLGLEVLDSLQNGFLEYLREEDGAKDVEIAIRQMMGDETKQLWIPIWSGTLDFLGRNEDA
jgi:hypothetical protein